jgi:glycosyl transferase, family 25
MHAYVINLARSTDRRAHITAELKKTGMDYEIMTAVDGREVNLGDRTLIDPALREVTQFLSGTAGAALSHLSVCRKIIESGLTMALVLEDDVTLPPDLKSLVDAVGQHLTGAEVALLSYDTPFGCQLGREGAVKLPSGRMLALPIDISQPRSGGAYVITRGACERMVKSLFPVRVNPDDWWHFYREGIIDRVRCVTPLSVRKTAKLESTLGSYSLGSGIRGRLVWPLVRRKLPILHQLLTYRRQRIYRRWGQAELVDVPFVEKPSRLD